MAKDAEIKVVLNTQEAIRDAEKFGPRLEKILNADIKTPDFTKWKDGIVTVLKQAELVTEQFDEAGKAVYTLSKSFTLQGLTEYSEKLVGILDTVEKIKTNEQQLADVQSKIAILKGEKSDDKQRSIRSLQGTYAATKNEKAKVAAKTAWEDAKKQLTEQEELEKKLIAEQTQLNSAFDEQYKELTPIRDEMENVSNISSRITNNVTECEQILNATTPKVEEVAEGEQRAADSAEQLANNTRDATEAAETITGAVNDAVDATKNLAEQTESVSSGLSDTTENEIVKQTGETTASLGDLMTAFIQARSNLQDFQRAGKDTTETEQTIAELAEQIRAKLRFPEAERDIGSLVAHLQDLSDAQKLLEKTRMTQVFGTEYANIVTDMELTKTAIRDYKKSVRDAATPHKEVEQAVTKMGSTVKTELEKTATTGRKFDREFGSSLKVIKNGFKSLSKSADRVKSSFNGMARSMKSNFKHLITSITKYVLGFRSLFFLVRRLRKYIGEGIKNMAQFNDGNNHVNQNITRLLSSLLYLKNAWATAFSPILQFVTPWLEALIDKLADLGNAFSRFLGSLLGQTNIFQAVKVDAADYADGLDKVGGSAGGAADKVKKLTDRLAAFDDLDVLGKDNDPDKTGSGGGGGSADVYTPDPNEMFTLINVGKEVLNQLKQMWETADFSEIGKTLAEKIKNALQGIKWSEIQSTAHKLGESFASFLNGILGDPELFTTIGNTLAQGINTAIQGLSGFFKTYKPGSLATDISAFFKGLFGGKDEKGNQLTDENGNVLGIDWTTLGSTISSGISTALNEAATLLKTFPTAGLISGITDLLKALNWSEIFANLLIFLGSTFDFGAGILNALADEINNLDVSDLDLSDLAEGFWNLLATVLVGSVKVATAATNLAMSLFSKILEALVALESSEDDEWNEFWSNAFDEVGGNLVAGLLNGISHALEGFADWAADHIGKPIVTWFEDTFDMHSPSKVAEQWGEWIIEGLLNGFTNFIADIKTKWEEIKVAIQTKVDSIKTTLAQKWQDIKDDAWTKFTLMRVAIVDIFNQLKEAVKTPINGFLGIIESMVNKVIYGINKVIDTLNVLPDIKLTNPFTGTEYALGFNIPKLSEISIPKLAQGAVIPPNKQFMAVLGDQSHGTNIEAPLDTIKQAVAEVLANNGNQEMIQLLQQLITVVENKNLTIGDKDIGKANARYNAQSKLIRGTSF